MGLWTKSVFSFSLFSYCIDLDEERSTNFAEVILMIRMSYEKLSFKNIDVVVVIVIYLPCLLLRKHFGNKYRQNISLGTGNISKHGYSKKRENIALLLK